MKRKPIGQVEGVWLPGGFPEWLPGRFAGFRVVVHGQSFGVFPEYAQAENELARVARAFRKQEGK